MRTRGAAAVFTPAEFGVCTGVPVLLRFEFAPFSTALESVGAALGHVLLAFISCATVLVDIRSPTTSALVAGLCPH